VTVKHFKKPVPVDFMSSERREPPEPREQSNSAERVTGRIAFFNKDKGIGFIRPDGDPDGKDIFFGMREASKLGAISHGDRVEYSVRLEGGNRFAAVDIRLL
jgi:cold shock CspA family protein